MSRATNLREDLFDKPCIEELSGSLLDSKRVRVSVLRLDKINDEIQGNKWFKLKLNIQKAIHMDAATLLSFGGAYSNHLLALAAAGQLHSLKTVGVLRGELVTPLNPVLRKASDYGMKLLPISRSDYRARHDLTVIAQHIPQLDQCFVIPEGGANALGVLGCEEIARVIAELDLGSSATVALACGTGTTMAGIVNGLTKTHSAANVLGFAVLKGVNYLPSQVDRWLLPNSNAEVKWAINEDFHCGGYAKIPYYLHEFVETFSSEYGIPIEGVYTGKMFYGLFSLIVKDQFPPGSHIVAIHSGGVHAF